MKNKDFIAQRRKDAKMLWGAAGFSLQIGGRAKRRVGIDRAASPQAQPLCVFASLRESGFFSSLSGSPQI
jgi:hypothetical protein